MSRRRAGMAKLRDDPVAVVRITNEFGPPLHPDAHRRQSGNQQLFVLVLREDAHIRVGRETDADLLE